VHRVFRDGTHAAAYPVETSGYQEIGRIHAGGDDIDAVAEDTVVRARGAPTGPRSSTGTRRQAAAARRRRLRPQHLRPHRRGRDERGARRRRASRRARAVFGLGAPGLLAVQLACRSCGRVTAVDRVEHRLTLAAAPT
jgi:hypothetical protein